jgi:hypothetical protein
MQPQPAVQLRPVGLGPVAVAFLVLATGPSNPSDVCPCTLACDDGVGVCAQEPRNEHITCLFRVSRAWVWSIECGCCGGRLLTRQAKSSCHPVSSGGDEAVMACWWVQHIGIPERDPAGVRAFANLITCRRKKKVLLLYSLAAIFVNLTRLPHRAFLFPWTSVLCASASLHEPHFSSRHDISSCARTRQQAPRVLCCIVPVYGGAPMCGEEGACEGPEQARAMAKVMVKGCWQWWRPSCTQAVEPVK